ncbi:MAG: hypothetical protein JHC95_18155 [Solirubrobacteraceae bacterium]|nr:hypothetical protein [Solirubrobacteraceae bacterium]
MRFPLIITSLLGAGLLAATGAAAQDDDSPPEIVATEYAFAGVDATQPKGAAEFAFRNDGKVTHEAILVKINEGHTLKEFLDADLEGKAGKGVGFTFAKPGKTGKPLKAKLSAGRYAFVCMLPDPKKKPHWSRGQIARFSVK